MIYVVIIAIIMLHMF